MQHGRRLRSIPLHKPLVFVAAQTFGELSLGKQIRATRCQRSGGHHIGRRVALHQSAGAFHITSQGIQNDSPHCRLHGIGSLVGRNAERDTGRTVAVQLNGLLDLFRIKPALFACSFQRPRFAALAHHRKARLVGHALVFKRPLKHRVKRIIPRISNCLGTIGLLIPNRKGLGITLRIQVACSKHHLRLGVDQIRQIGPTHDKVFVVELVGHDVANPAQHQCHVCTRTNRQPDIGAHGFRNKTRINDDRANALGTQTHDGVATGGRTAVGRICTPQHQCLHFRVGVVDFARLFVSN